jgi:HEPN domain-containing protein
MSTPTTEWAAKAEADYRVMLRESKVVNDPSPDAVCFHAQQCIEKYAKAFLNEKGVEFPRTHNLEYLHGLCVGVDQEFAPYKIDFKRLDDYSVEIRYPGVDAAEEDAKEAVIVATRLRALVRAKLGLDQPATPEGN